MNNEFIYSMIRRKLGLKKHQRFQFENQISTDTYYYFTRNKLIKRYNSKSKFWEQDSGVSLNFLMSKDCHIRKYGRASVNKNH